MSFPAMPEVVLRTIWQQQNFSTQDLKTADGRPVTILFPGTPNTDGGPDFRNAKISIGSITFLGDVELHIGAEEWRTHRHDTDPHYNKVILHVVITADPLSPPERTASRRPIPLLVLHPFLDARFQDAWMHALHDDGAGKSAALACSDINDEIPASVITRWLERLSLERLELKICRFEERLKQLVDEARHVVHEPYPRYYGNPAEIPLPKHTYTKRDFASRGHWEQLLYEGIMEALGYSKNARPFLELSRSLRLHSLQEHLHETTHVMAMLFGVAGLLPLSREVHSADSRTYVLMLKKKWKAARPAFKGRILNSGDWLFFRLRPSNFPTTRLATMAFLFPKLFGRDAFRSLVGIFKDRSLTSQDRVRRLHELFTFEADEFWQSHYHFTAPADRVSRKRTASLLGNTRINDIVVNVVIPIMVLYARIFKDVVVGKSARLILTILPASQENALTSAIQNQLSKEKLSLKSASLQQGAIQLFRFYCSPLRCSECPIGRRTMSVS
ncbi:MAG: DUF2851 family protein [Ignavibacteriae bacterium]|nr:DUF2851 family protein [Ignavibacteriota bacterium]